MNLTLSKNSATATSEWTGTYVIGGAVSYSTPTWDYDNITISVPAALVNATFKSVTITYDVSPNISGSKFIRFSDTREDLTNARLLTRLQNGETSIQLLFGFKASGGSGGVGTHSSTCRWTNFAIEVEYLPAAEIMGTVNFSSSSITYGLSKGSVLTTDKFDLTLAIKPSAKATAIKVEFRPNGETDVKSLSYTISAAANTQTALKKTITLSGLDMSAHAAKAQIRFTLTTSSGTQTSAWTTTQMYIVKSRIAPTVTAASTDTNGYRAAYGVYVQGKSALKITLTVGLDTAADPNISIKSQSLAINGTTYTSGNGVFTISTASLTGTVSYTATVTDSYGLSGRTTGSINVAPYSAPRITALSVTRVAEIIDEETGQTILVPEDDSPTVELNLKGVISNLNGHNTWTIRWKYGSTWTSLTSGEEGVPIDLTGMSWFAGREFAANRAWPLTFEISDAISASTMDITIPKAGAIFDVELGGVAVGKRSTGTAAAPLFESAYKAVFDKGIYSGTKRVDYDTGWTDLTLTNSTAYNTSNHMTRARRFGEVVSLAGQIKLNASLANNSYVQIMTLPSAYRPDQTLVIRCGGTISACDLWINAGGSVNLYNRSGAAIGTSANISIACTYMI